MNKTESYKRPFDVVFHSGCRSGVGVILCLKTIINNFECYQFEIKFGEIKQDLRKTDNNTFRRNIRPRTESYCVGRIFWSINQPGLRTGNCF